jgi:hypothetical protein
MFSEDDMSTEVIVLQDQTQRQQVLLLCIIVSSLNLRAKNMTSQLLPRQSVIILQRIIKVLMFSILNNNRLEATSRETSQ